MLTRMWIRNLSVFALALIVTFGVVSGCNDDGGGGGQSSGPPPGGPPPANLQMAADDAYEKIRHIFEFTPVECAAVNPEDFECNYWQLGNAFDTVIDYLVMNPFNAPEFANAVIKRYDETANTAWRCWYDDSGWWAVAAQRALEHPDLWSKDQLVKFGEIAADNWDTMQDGLNVYKNRNDHPGNFDDLQPRFDGGIWNYFWSSEHLEDVCQTPCDPNNSALCGRQNTVTNGLYLVAASMRATDTGDELYKQAAGRELGFLLQWFDPMNFDEDEIGNNLLYRLDILGPGGVAAGPAVVRERVSTYHKINNHPPVRDPNYDVALIWAGDQGLILGGLLRSIGAVPSGLNPQILDLAKRITDGVREYLLNADGTLFFPWSEVIHPTPSTIGGAPNAGDDNDYDTGIGVYMRYLLYAYQSNNEMRQHLQDTGYPELVLKFAEDFASQDAGLCYPIPKPDEGEHCSDLVKYTNKLSAVVAALGMR